MTMTANAAKCPDCGLDHQLSVEEHNLVCESRTCDLCLNSFPDPVPVTEIGERVCRECQRDMTGGGVDAEYANSEEEDEYGTT